MSLLNIRDLSYWSNSSLSSVNSAYFTFCFSSVSTDILKPGWNNLSSTNLFLCSPVSPEVGKSSASECEYDRRDCDQLQMVEDKLQYTACHVNNSCGLLGWVQHQSCIQEELHFLKKLKSPVVASTVCLSALCWGCSIRGGDTNRLKTPIGKAGSVTAC